MLHTTTELDTNAHASGAYPKTLKIANRAWKGCAVAKVKELPEYSYRGFGGEIYDCPTIKAVDAYLVQNSASIKKCSPLLVNKLKVLQLDRDLLLDLRWLLAPNASSS
jgi:hypothetical protein